MNVRAAIPMLALILASSPAYAQQGIGPGGLPALVRQLQAAITEISDLRARVEKLESGAVTEQDLVGRYHFQMLGIELGANPNVAIETAGAYVTLKADRTGSFSFAGDSGQGRCELANEPAWTVACDLFGAGTEEFTWRVEGDKFIFSDEDGDHASVIGAGGRIIVFGESTPFMAGRSWSNLVMAIRLPD